MSTSTEHSTGLRRSARIQARSTKPQNSCSSTQPLGKPNSRYLTSQGSPDADNNGSVELHVLCHTCQKFIRKSHIINDIPWAQRKDRYEQFRHYSTFGELSASCLKGCHLCTLFWHQGRHELSGRRGGTEKPQRKRRYITVEVQCQSGRMNLHVKLDGKLGKRHHWSSTFLSFEIELFPARSNDKGYQSHRPDPLVVHHPAQIATSTQSEASFELAREWLHECLRSHSICSSVASIDPHPPTRLLDVGSPDGQTELKPRLQEFAALGSRPNYLTLSHCWGGTKTYQLTSSTYESLRVGIAMDVLPKSFRDAVLITRKLGYRYLWVDSLCIVQDDQSDWAREAANMGDIYRGATCTIAALAARNSQAGCFVKRNPLAIRSCRILGNAKNGIYVRGRDIVMEFHTHGKVSSAQPLHERAWVVQEQLLSPRTLYYGSEAILWECVELDATEGRPQGNTWDWKEDRRYRRPKEAFMSLMLSPRAVPGVVDDEFRSFYQAWAKVLRDYSSCSLTRPEDKLVAISGIIRVIEKRTGLQSVAGMWREYFLQEMIWRTFVPVQRPSPYRAPSWSWASIDNAVILDYLQLEQNYELEGRMELLHLEAPPTTPVSQHPLLLPRAYMRVRAALRRVYWHHTVDREPYYLHLEPESGWTQDHWYPDVPPEPSLEIWCMRILHGKALKDQLGSRVDIGSILTKCEGPKNTWTRVGYFQQHHSDMSRERAFFGPGIATQLIDIV